jgi:hypothetical protein
MQPLRGERPCQNSSDRKCKSHLSKFTGLRASIPYPYLLPRAEPILFSFLLVAGVLELARPESRLRLVDMALGPYFSPFAPATAGSRLTRTWDGAPFTGCLRFPFANDAGPIGKYYGVTWLSHSAFVILRMLPSGSLSQATRPLPPGKDKTPSSSCGRPGSVMKTTPLPVRALTIVSTSETRKRAWYVHVA